MIVEIFNALLYQPMLNALILIYIGVGSFGLAVIILTLFIKALTHSMNKKAIESQKKIAELQPKIKELQEKYKDDKERMSIEMLSLWKLHKFNPFAGILPLFVQIPVVIALYWVFMNGFDLEKIKPMLYSFVTITDPINSLFLMIDLSKASIPLAFVAAIVQYYQARSMSIKNTTKKKEGEEPEVSEIIQKQMTYVVPAITLAVLWTLPSAIGLYWVTSSVITIIEQKIVMKNS